MRHYLSVSLRRFTIYILVFGVIGQLIPGTIESVEAAISSLPNGTSIEQGVVDRVGNSNQFKEVVEKRTANGRFFESPEGKGYATLSLSPVNYKTSQGSYEPIDNTLVPEVGLDTASSTPFPDSSSPTATERAEKFDLRNKANQFTSRFKKGSSTDFFQLSQNDHQASFSLKDANFGQSEIKDNTITYKNAYPNIDLHYSVLESSIKSDITLTDAPTIKTIPYQLRLSTGLQLREESDKTLSIIDSNNKTVWQLPPPSIRHPLTHDMVYGHYDVRQLNQSADSMTYEINLPIIDAFLPNPEMGYPVTIDPTIIVPDGGESAYVLKGQPDWTHSSSSPILPVGLTEHDVSRSFLKFDVSSIPAGATIDGAMFGIASDEERASISRVKLYRVNQDWSANAITWNNQPAVGSTSEASATNNIVYSWWNFDITQLVKDWRSGTANYGLSLQAHDETISRRNFISKYYNTTNFKPYIMVYYDTNPSNSLSLPGLQGWWRYISHTIGEAKSSVNIANGNLALNFTDTHSQGRGLDTLVTHTYNSQGATANTQLGQGWTLSAHKRLVPSADRKTVTYIDETGTPFTFRDSNGDNNYIDSVYDSASGFYKRTDHRPNGLSWGLRYDPGTGRYIAKSNNRVAYLFDGSGRILEERDRNDNTLTYSYESDRLAAITDSSGRQVKLNYNIYGQLINITDHNTNDPAFASTAGKVTYSYTSGKLGVVSFYTGAALTGRLTFSYTGSRLDSILDGLSNKTQFLYDNSNRVTTVIDGVGKQTKLVYPSKGLTQVISEKGNAAGANAADFTTDYFYQANPYFQPGLIYREVSPPLKNDQGQLVRQTTEYDYNDDFFLQGITDSKGLVDASAYDDISGLLTWQFDKLKIVTLKNSYSSSSYDNGDWRLIDSYNGNGVQTMFYYDDRGNLIRKSVMDGAINLLHNPGYESVTRVDNSYVPDCSFVKVPVADYWCGAGSRSNNRIYGIENNSSTDGIRSHFIGFNNNTTTGSVNVFQTIDETTQPDPEKDYVLTWKYRQETAANMDVEIALQHVDTLGNVIGDTILAPRSPRNGDWTSGSYTFKTPKENPANGRPYWTTIVFMRTVANATGVNGKAWFDSVKVEEGPVASQQTEQVAIYTYTNANQPNPTGRPLTEVTPDGKSFNYQWDSSGNLLKATDPAGNIVEQTYDANGNRLSKTEPKGVVTSDNPTDYKTVYTYNSRNRLTSVTEAATGNKTSYAYDRNGHITSVVTPGGLKTTYTYDPAGRPNKTITPYSYESTVQYDAQGNPIGITDPNKQQNSVSFDAANRLEKEIDPSGQETSYSYNHLDQLQEMVEGSKSLQYSHDAAGQVTSETVKTDSTNKSIQYQYDNAGNLSVTNTQTGEAVSYQYTSTDEITKVTAGGKTTAYQHNKNNQLTQLVRGNNDTVKLEYNSNGQPAQLSQSRDNTVYQNFAYNYDPNGNISQVVSAKNGTSQTVNYDYDNQNQLKTVQRPEKTVNYLYNRDNNITGIQESTGKKTSFLYDGNRLLRKTVNPGNLLEFYEYDALGNMTSRDTGDRISLLAHLNDTTTNERDNLSGATVGPVSYEAGKFGQALRLGSNSYLGYSAAGTFNRDIRTVEFWVAPHWDSTDTATRVFLDAPYNSTNFVRLQKNSDGKLQFINKVTDVDYGLISNQPVTWQTNVWQHIAVVWTTGKTSLYVNGQLVGEKTGTLKVMANRLTQIAFGAQLQPTPSQFADVSFDEIKTSSATRTASEISRSAKATTELKLLKTTRYEYDGQQYLTKVTQPDGTVVSYGYDPQKRLIKRSQTGQADINYRYDGDILTQEVANDGTVLTKFSYDIKDNLLSITRGNETYYPVTDHLGSIVGLRDSNGTMVNSYSYDEWGSLLSKSESFPNPIRYAKYWYDDTVGMYHLGARWYDPSIARFTSADPHAGDQDDPLSLNEYIYTANNPLTRVDPDGDTWGQVIAGAAIGLAIALSFVGAGTIAGAMLTGAISGALFSGAEAFLHGARGNDLVMATVKGAAIGALGGAAGLALGRVLEGALGAIASKGIRFNQGNTRDTIFAIERHPIYPYKGMGFSTPPKVGHINVGKYLHVIKPSTARKLFGTRFRFLFIGKG